MRPRQQPGREDDKEDRGDSGRKQSGTFQRS
jgi:hypothetical protein